MMTENLLAGRTAFVTGGTSALGRGISTAFLERGANVVLGDLDVEKLKAVSQELNTKFVNRKVAYTVLNLLDQNSIGQALDEAEKSCGTIDILVNNAGVCIMNDIMTVPDKNLQLTFGVNVFGLFSISRYFVKNLVRRKVGGNIVNIASNAAKVCFEGQIDYNSSKAAVVNMTQSMAKEWAKYNINVNAVCPGAVDTDMLRKCMIETEKKSNGAVTVEDCRKTWGPPQLGRLVQPYEVGRVVCFLASDEAVIVRGQSLSVDGGNTPY